ncbi:EF-P 5-aminopentanol modification-associated protein YfmF [Alkalibacillus almallahensis]|uniref:EF-P 5-aminopentanol modification-associated protein YfmF n=1 Tax=Alkalibacillus almallahensis TaxID=1379154 RepID=UPI0014249280|nr:pitrilysin family protein [Alkalibacillus almallahensis]NIK10848.1 putative Zn-dependent peptidase [Alkalibacillus almallahensis]
MNTLVDNQIDHQDYQLHMIPTTKFKTNTIALKFARPIERDTITSRALLPFVLQKGTKKFPSERELRLELDRLYGAKFSINGAKKGENHIITLTLDLPNEKFIDAENDLLKQGVQFLHEVVANPKLIDQAFDPDLVAKEKETLENKINSIVDEKMQYANMRLVDEMCQDESFGIRSHGYIDDLDSIDGTTLYDTYQDMIQHDRMDIYVVGDVEDEAVQQLFESEFQLERQNPVEIKEADQVEAGQMNTISEAQKLQQAKLHFGYRTQITYRDENYPALQVFNGIFGGFPHSKLFLNVREKHSLAYYAASRFESHKGLLFVFSGIAPEKYEEAKDIIMKQHESIQEGNISDDELEQTKKAIIHSLKETLDQSRGIIDWHYQQVVGGKQQTNQDVIDAIQEVTKDDVKKVANLVALDTIYLLTSEDGGAQDA